MKFHFSRQSFFCQYLENINISNVTGFKKENNGMIPFQPFISNNNKLRCIFWLCALFSFVDMSILSAKKVERKSNRLQRSLY